MNKPLVSKLSLLALSMAALLWPAGAGAQQKAGQISRFLAPAFVDHPQARTGLPPTPVPAAEKLPVLFNDVLRTEQGGRLRATLNDGSILSLGSSARLTVVQHNEQTQQSNFQLQYGRVRAQVVRLSRPDSRFEIRTNTAVCGVLGTDELVDATNPVATVVMSISGIVTVRSSDPSISGATVLNAGEATTVEQGRAPGPARRATQQELNNGVNDTSGGTGPEANAHFPEERVEAGGVITLDGGASSGGLTAISRYLWEIPQRPFTSTDRVVTLDTTGWRPGVYRGTLTVTAADGRTARVAFQFTLIGSTVPRGSPEDFLNSLARAYESLQVSNFMSFFDARLYANYSATQQSITQAFGNIAEIRVYVRKANGLISGNTAIYQADFEVRFTLKASALPSSPPSAAAASVVRASSLAPAAALGSISGSTGAVATLVTLSGPVNGTFFTGNGTSYSFANLADGTYTVTPSRQGFTFTPPSRAVIVSGGAQVAAVNFVPAAQTQVIVEHATLRLIEVPGSGWRASDLQGNLGSLELPGVIGTANPLFANTPAGPGQAGAGNPVPAINSLSPSSVTAGGAGFTLTVNGANFVSGAVVNVNGNPRATSFGSATQLTATILLGDIATAGTALVTVVNPSPGGGTSNAVTLNINNPVPAIASLAPSSATAGGAAFTLTVNGANFVPASLVFWNGGLRTTTPVSATQLTAAIPATDLAAAGSASVAVLTPGPGGGTSNAVTFTINNPVPAITSLAPSSATAGGPAFTLTVNGTGFISGSVVQVNGNARPTSFGSAVQLTSTIPAADIGSPGTFLVTVVNGGPGGGTSNAATFTINNPVPAITSLSPTSSTAGGANFTLTVNGTNFVSGSVVQVGGNARTTSFVNAQRVTATILAADIATAGTLSVTVVNPAPGGGTSNTATFTVNNPAPTITSLSPASAAAGGANFTLAVNGTNFVAGSVVQVNGNARVTSLGSATQLSAAILAADIASPGTLSVTVVNPSPGGGTSNTVTFTINNPAPAINSLAPSSVTAGGANFTLTVNGTGFVSGSVVQVNGNSRATSFGSAAQVTATILAGDIAVAGTLSVTVVNPAPGGGTSGAATLTIVNPAPAIGSLSPSSTLAGGSNFTLTVIGTGFVSGAAVLVNGSPRATSFGSATQLTAAILASDIALPGTFSVTVVNPAPGGGASNSVTFTITGNPVPAISSLSPSSSLAGGPNFTLTVNGTNFIASSVVRVNGNSRATSFVSAVQLTATVLASDIASPGTFSVTVFNPTPGGGTSNTATFTITGNPVPAISSLSPSSAIVGGAGFTLTVNGTGFVATSVVNWNGSPRTTTFVSSIQVTAAIPASDIASTGTNSVTVVNPTPGGGTSNTVTFTINNPGPTIASLSPSSATAGGAGFTLTVNGTGFVANSVVNWNGSPRTTTFVTSIQVTAAIPLSDIASAGTASVTVANPMPGGGTSAAATFTINNPAPTIGSLSPSSAIAAGAGFTLTVNGTGFVATSVVNWNGSPRTTAFVSSVQVTAAIPASDIASGGTASVTVVNPTPGGGTSNTSTFSIIILNPVPTLTSLSPPIAPPGGAGFTLTVNGTGFVATSVVNWNGSPRTTAFVSSVQVTAAIPATDIVSPGTALVTVFNPTPGGGTSGSLTFTIANPFSAVFGTGSAGPLTVPVSGSNQVILSVTFNAAFPGPAVVTPAAVTGANVSPSSVTLTSSGLATFTYTGVSISAQASYNFTAASTTPVFSVTVTSSINVASASLSVFSFPSPYFIGDKQTMVLNVTPSAAFLGSGTVASTAAVAPFTGFVVSGSATVALSSGTAQPVSFDASSTGTTTDAGPGKVLGTFTVTFSGAPNMAGTVTFASFGSVTTTAPFSNAAAVVSGPSGTNVFTGATGVSTDPNQTKIVQTLTAAGGFSASNSVFVSSAAPNLGNVVGACLPGSTIGFCVTSNTFAISGVTQTWYVKVLVNQPSGTSSVMLAAGWSGPGGTFTATVASVSVTVTPPFTLVQTFPDTTSTAMTVAQAGSLAMTAQVGFAIGFLGSVPLTQGSAFISPASATVGPSSQISGFTVAPTTSTALGLSVATFTAGSSSGASGTTFTLARAFNTNVVKPFEMVVAPTTSSGSPVLISPSSTLTLDVGVQFNPGFGGSVTVTFTGVSATFFATSTCSGCALILGTSTVSASLVTTSTAGTTSFTVNGSLVGAVAPTISTTVFVNITTSAPDFFISVDPATTSGSPVQFNASLPKDLTLTVTPVNGFSGTVSVDLSSGTIVHTCTMTDCGIPQATSFGLFVSGSPNSAFILYTALFGTTVTAGSDSFTIRACTTPPGSPCPVAGSKSLTVFVKVGSLDPRGFTSSLFFPPLDSHGLTATMNPINGFSLSLSTIVQASPANVQPLSISPLPSAPVTISPGGSAIWTLGAPSSIGTAELVNMQIVATFSGTFLTSPVSGTATKTFQICIYSAIPTGLCASLATGAVAFGFGPPIFSMGRGPMLQSAVVGTSAMRAKGEAGPSPDLAVSANDVTYTPLLPKEGDLVKFRVRVKNLSSADARNVEVALTLDQVAVAQERVDVRAQQTLTVELEWKAVNLHGHQLALVVDQSQEPADSDRRNNLVLLKGLFVEPGGASSRRERLTLVARNEDCTGVRFRSASQSSCGGAVDLEVFPVLTDAGTLEVELAAPQGGMRDLGVMPLAGMTMTSAHLPAQNSLQPNGLFEEGHTYLVKSRNLVTLVRVIRLKSSINPRLAAIAGGGVPTRGGRKHLPGRVGDDVIGDIRDQESADRLLRNAQITIDLEWISEEQ